MRDETEARLHIEQTNYRLRDHLGWAARAIDNGGMRPGYVEHGLDILGQLVSAQVDKALHELIRDKSFFELLCRAAGSQEDGKL